MLLKSWFDEILFGWWEIISRFSTLCESQCGKIRKKWNGHSVEKREIHSNWKFREINSLVTSLVQPLLSRNFCQKCVTVCDSNIHIENYSKFWSAVYLQFLCLQFGYSTCKWWNKTQWQFWWQPTIHIFLNRYSGLNFCNVPCPKECDFLSFLWETIF